MEGSLCKKGHVVICSKVHAISLDLHLNRSDAKLSPARKFAVNSVSNTPGTAACRCKLPACCNCRLKSYDPVLLIFNVGLIEIAEVYFKWEPAFLWYILGGHFCQFFNSDPDVFDCLVVEIPAWLVVERKVAVYPL